MTRCVLSLVFACSLALSSCFDKSVSNNDDMISPDDWPSYGRTADEQHYSPLDRINAENISDLGLVWSYDLPVGHSASVPLAVNGMLYVTVGHSDVIAFDAATGKQQWMWQSNARTFAGGKLRQGYGPRGIAHHDGRLFVGTHDGRLVALDAKTGKEAWSAQTVSKTDNAYITGAPRAFAGKVIIGFGGADGGGVRGYVSCYEADTGRRLWKFYTVPGNPAVDTDETTRLTAKTWNGEWWKDGGGGTAWNALVYDPDLDRFYIGTGNGYPYNQKLRSPGGGDNLFLSSIVAVDAQTGKYIWHYQINPGEQWDYKATQDITLADVTIDGNPRKILMQAPTNGFFYVIDRVDGKLISAEPFTKVTWAERIDTKTGRPVENPGARFDGTIFEMWPSIIGGHSVQPQSYSPRTGLLYLPTIERGMLIGDKGVDLSKESRERHPNNINAGMGVTGDFAPELPGMGSFLQAWDPVTQKARWRVDLPGHWPGGTMVTGGNLVFQGRIDNKLQAYDANNGKLLWSYDARSPVIAAPISFAVGGTQYVTVLTGNGASGGGYHGALEQQFGIDYRTQPRRVLTFAIGGKAILPPAPAPVHKTRPGDPGYRANAPLEMKGAIAFAQACGTCHGGGAAAAGTAPDLRMSSTIRARDVFFSIVKGGALVENGMPQFDDAEDDWLEAVRHYLRARSQALPVDIKDARNGS